MQTFILYIFFYKHRFFTYGDHVSGYILYLIDRSLVIKRFNYKICKWLVILHVVQIVVVSLHSIQLFLRVIHLIYLQNCFPAEVIVVFKGWS